VSGSVRVRPFPCRIPCLINSLWDVVLVDAFNEGAGRCPYQANLDTAPACALTTPHADAPGLAATGELFDGRP